MAMAMAMAMTMAMAMALAAGRTYLLVESARLVEVKVLRVEHHRPIDQRREPVRKLLELILGLALDPQRLFRA